MGEKGDSNAGSGGTPLQVGRYECDVELTRSSIGAVWSGRVASGAEAGRRVEIRRIPRGSLGSEAVDRLTNAGFLSMEVRDPKIAAVLDIVLGDAELSIVSEHVDGIRLRDVLSASGPKRVQCPPSVALRIAVDALEGLQAAREKWNEVSSADSEEDRALRACAYGGLLPDYLLIATFGETMLTDFGVAGVVSTISALSDHADVLPYRAPEHLTGVIDEQGDVFMIGILLWELIAGRPLFGSTFATRPVSSAGAMGEAAKVSTIRRKLQSGPIARLDTQPKWKGIVPKPIADVVARALERERGRRFQTIDEFLSACRDLGADLVAAHDEVAAFLAKQKPRHAPLRPGRSQRAESDPPASTRPTVPPLIDASKTPTLREVDAPDSERDTTIPDKGPAVDVPPPPPAVVAAGSEPPPPTTRRFRPAGTAAAEPIDAEPISVEPESLDESAPSDAALSDRPEAPTVPTEIVSPFAAPDAGQAFRDTGGADITSAGDLPARPPSAPAHKTAPNRQVLLGGAAVAGLVLVVGASFAILGGSSEDEATESASEVAESAAEKAPAAPAKLPEHPRDESEAPAASAQASAEPEQAVLDAAPSSDAAPANDDEDEQTDKPQEPARPVAPARRSGPKAEPTTKKRRFRPSGI